MTDSTRSPRIAVVAVVTDRRAIFQKSNDLRTGKTSKATKTAMKDPTYPPMNPITLLFGLAATNPRLFFPIVIPKNHAHESHPKINRRNILTIALGSGNAAIRLMKDMKNPQNMTIISDEPSFWMDFSKVRVVRLYPHISKVKTSNNEIIIERTAYISEKPKMTHILVESGIKSASMIVSALFCVSRDFESIPCNSKEMSVVVTKIAI